MGRGGGGRRARVAARRLRGGVVDFRERADGLFAAPCVSSSGTTRRHAASPSHPSRARAPMACHTALAAARMLLARAIHRRSPRFPGAPRARDRRRRATAAAARGGARAAVSRVRPPPHRARLIAMMSRARSPRHRPRRPPPDGLAHGHLLGRGPGPRGRGRLDRRRPGRRDRQGGAPRVGGCRPGHVRQPARSTATRTGPRSGPPPSPSRGTSRSERTRRSSEAGVCARRRPRPRRPRRGQD